MSIIEKYSKPQKYWEDVSSFLLQNEAENCLGIGIIDTLLTSPERFPVFHLGSIKSDDRKSVVGAMWITPPFPLGITRISSLEVQSIVEFALELLEKPSGVVGPSETVESFVELWKSATGASIASCMKQGVYELSRVEVKPATVGSMRLASEDDRALLENWSLQFSVDCGLGEDSAKAKAYADQAIKQKNRYFWEVEGLQVSMAGISGNTPNGIRIAWVYTPPELRGKGYASSLVASLSQYQLDSGKKFCFLYTDLSNPTSNSIYQRIGYRKISESTHYTFAY